MNRLFVLYDARCGLCRWARDWASQRPSYLDLVFIPADSDEARRLFPTESSADTPEELVVVGDGGEVYRGGSAWVMVLYALEETREWSLRLGSPALLPMARQGFGWASRHRRHLSRWLGLDDHDLAEAIGQEPAVACDVGLPVARPAAVRSPAAWRRKFDV